MRTGKSAPKKRRVALGKDRSPEEVSRLVGTACRASKREAGGSVRDIVRWTGLAKSTVEKHLAEGFDIPWIGPRRLAVPFLKCLLALVSERNHTGRA
jgi:hypothetical protein